MGQFADSQHAAASSDHSNEQDDDEMDTHEFHQDLRGFGISQVLPVDLEQAASGVEDEALRYLQQVREEAGRIPMVITSQVDARAFDDQRTTSYISAEDDCTREYPPYPWMCQVVDDFVTARAEVSTSAAGTGLPAVTDWQAWNQLISQEQFQPFSTTLAKMDNSLVAQCLTHLTDKLRGSRAGEHISPHAGLWLYGLLVRLEKPIHSRMAATLRQMTKTVHKLRAAPATAVPSSPEALALVPVYDTLLVLSGGFFGQDATLAPLVDEHLWGTR